MNFLCDGIAVYFSILFLFLLVLIIAFVVTKRDETGKSFLPRISVLLAFRNEEENVLPCLQSIAAIDYPLENIEVLIGDDLSEDGTVARVKNFIAGRENFHLFLIKEKTGLAGAKGNVLAQLAKEAKGDFFFITDADVRVPSSWVKGLLEVWKPGIATVSGSAMISGKSTLSMFQSIDWITAFGMIRTATKIGIPVTAVGNNMMVTREAYLDSGGYENIPFSVTEDFDLHEVLRKKGWKHLNLLNPQTLTRTQAIKGFTNILQQRKRWMHGAVRLPFILVFLLSLQAVFFPVIVLGLICCPEITIFGWALKFILQNIFLMLLLKRARQSLTLLKYSVPYEMYSGVCSLVLIVYYFLPLKTDWKGRKYE